MAKNQLAKGASLVIKREIEKGIKADREAFGSVATSLLSSMALIVLHDEFGFGKQRLNTFKKAFESQCECVIGEFVSMEDLETLAEELLNKIKTYK